MHRHPAAEVAEKCRFDTRFYALRRLGFTVISMPDMDRRSALVMAGLGLAVAAVPTPNAAANPEQPLPGPEAPVGPPPPAPGAPAIDS